MAILLSSVGRVRWAKWTLVGGVGFILLLGLTSCLLATSPPSATVGPTIDNAVIPATATPSPTSPKIATPDRPTYTPRPPPGTTGNARIRTRTPVPVFAYTPAPTLRRIITLEPTPGRSLAEVDCDPNDCTRQYEPPWNYVDWLAQPSVSVAGTLTFQARIDERITFEVPGRQGRGSATLSDLSHDLYGVILAPAHGDWHWIPEPGRWIAREYTYVNRILTVVVDINPAAATHSGLRLCLWSGGTKDETKLLDCTVVIRP